MTEKEVVEYKFSIPKELWDEAKPIVKTRWTTVSAYLRACLMKAVKNLKKEGGAQNESEKGSI